MTLKTVNQVGVIIEIASNSGGSIVFSSDSDLHNFARTTAKQLAGLTHVVKDGMSSEEMSQTTMYLINNMAWQLERAIDLIIPQEVTHG